MEAPEDFTCRVHVAQDALWALAMLPTPFRVTLHTAFLATHSPSQNLISTALRSLTFSA